MSFDGIFLHHLSKEFEPLINGKLNKISEIGDLDFIFDIRAFGKSYKLLTSFSSDFARIHLANRMYESTPSPRSFTMLLRKHIEGYKLTNLKQIETDRIIEMEFTGFNDFQDLCKKYLILEIMGRYSNLILTDSEYKIIDSLKHDGASEFNRTILPNAIYTYPVQDKLNPYKLSESQIEEKFLKITTPKELMQTFQGISLTLAYKVLEDKNPYYCFYESLNNTSLIKPVSIKNHKGSNDFYFTSYDYQIEKEYDTISILLEEYYYHADKQAKIKLKTNDILTFVNRQIKRNTSKIEKLEKEKIEAMDAESYKIKGELLLSTPNLKSHAESIEVYNYYTDKFVTIFLDSKYNILDNSKKFYKKYQKMKTSLTHIDEQINICNDEIAYFKILQNQIIHANMTDIAQITEELKSLKYTKQSMKQNNRKQKIKVLTYVVDDALIMVGKNNLQNEYLTHKLAKPNDLWFHVKDAPGSHVILNKSINDATEEQIRAAAMIAAYYSTFKDSSSIAVNYTYAKYIKKIPGKRSCFVSISHEKTIYIDILEDYISKLKVVN